MNPFSPQRRLCALCYSQVAPVIVSFIRSIRWLSFRLCCPKYRKSQGLGIPRTARLDAFRWHKVLAVEIKAYAVLCAFCGRTNSSLSPAAMIRYALYFISLHSCSPARTAGAEVLATSCRVFAPWLVLLAYITHLSGKDGSCTALAISDRKKQPAIRMYRKRKRARSLCSLVLMASVE